MYYIYMLRCEDNSIYTGITTDVERRINEHFAKNEKSAKYTYNHTAQKLEAIFEADNRSNASKLEYHIKKLSKKQKEQLIIKNNLHELLDEKLDVNLFSRIEL